VEKSSSAPLRGRHPGIHLAGAAPLCLHQREAWLAESARPCHPACPPSTSDQLRPAALEAVPVGQGRFPQAGFNSAREMTTA